MSKKLFLITILLMVTIPSLQATELGIGYNSRYVSEGRNQLFSGGIYWINGGHNIDENISLGLAYGYASNSDLKYDELNLSIFYANAINGIDYFVGYTRLEFFEDNESDDEISLGLSYTEIDYFTPFVNFVYSVEADGYFIDIGLQKEFLLNDNLAIAPYAVITYDYDYAGGDRNGHNHTYIGATVSYSLADNTTISAIFEQTFGGNTIKREGNKPDQFWSGIHFIYSW